MEHHSIVEALLTSGTVQEHVHAALKAEGVHVEEDAPQAFKLSLMNLGFPVPPEIQELAKQAASSKPVTQADAEKATAAINKMLQEETTLLDHKVVDCREKRRRAGEATQDAASAVRDLASETSAARSIIVEAASRLPQDRRSFQEFKAEAEKSHIRCQDAENSAKTQAQNLERDAAGVAAVKQGLSQKCGGASFTQKSTYDAGETSGKIDDESALHGISVLHAQRKKDLEATGCLDVAAALGVVSRKRSGQAAGGFLQDMQPSIQCTLTPQNCAAMLDVAAEVEGEIADSQSRLRAQSAQARDACKDENLFVRNQLSMETGQASDRSRELDEATNKAGQVGDLVNQKDSERQKLQVELKAITANCTADINGILYGKICSLQKVRDSLQLLAGKKELPEDCQVTDWEEGVCSTTCGGGSKTLTRSVIVPANGGAECPPLTLTLNCGETACPVDCEVTQFGDWSACSAQCNGGVQERNRVVTVKPVGNGVACPHLVDMRLCNTESCTDPCELLQWTPWTPCNKACGGGVQMRTRGLKDEGKASCPGTGSIERHETRECSKDACASDRDMMDATIKCKGEPMDVVLLLDGSASITEPGFALLKQLSLQLVEAYSLATNGTKLSIASFAKSAKVVSILTDDASDVKSKINSQLTWQQGPSNAGAALTRAIALLANGGRQAASSLVLMVSDGRPVDPFLAKQAAEKVKRTGARLAFALIGTGYKNLELFRDMASKPDSDNIIQLPDFSQLSTYLKFAANKIVAGTCSAVTVAAATS